MIQYMGRFCTKVASTMSRWSHCSRSRDLHHTVVKRQVKMFWTMLECETNHSDLNPVKTTKVEEYIFGRKSFELSDSHVEPNTWSSNCETSLTQRRFFQLKSNKPCLWREAQRDFPFDIHDAFVSDTVLSAKRQERKGVKTSRSERETDRNRELLWIQDAEVRGLELFGEQSLSLT